MGFKEKWVFKKIRSYLFCQKLRKQRLKGKLGEDNRNAVTQGQHNGAGEEIYRRSLPHFWWWAWSSCVMADSQEEKTHVVPKLAVSAFQVGVL